MKDARETYLEAMRLFAEQARNLAGLWGLHRRLPLEIVDAYGSPDLKPPEEMFASFAQSARSMAETNSQSLAMMNATAGLLREILDMAESPPDWWRGDDASAS
jgi:hypothetical protein